MAKDAKVDKKRVTKAVVKKANASGATPISTMADLLKKYPLQVKTFRRGHVVEGVVIDKSKSAILVDVGAKSEGIITRDEFSEDPHAMERIELGDTILASVVQSENDQGYLVLSLKRAQVEKRWRELYQAFEKKTTIEVKVTDRSKSGLLCDLTPDAAAEDKVVGFIPYSHIKRELMPQGNREGAQAFDSLIGSNLTVKVLEIDRQQRRLVLSQRDVVDKSVASKKQTSLEKIKVGDKVSGKVTTILPFGLFLEIGEGVEGLIHISEVSRERVGNLAEMFEPGKVLTAVVIDVVPGEGRLGLSLKALTPDPWETIEGRYKNGDKVKGVVSKIMPYGAFITLEPGLDGLVHVSETVGPMNVGDLVEAAVLNIDKRGKRMGLSVRKLSEKP